MPPGGSSRGREPADRRRARRRRAAGHRLTDAGRLRRPPGCWPVAGSRAAGERDHRGVRRTRPARVAVLDGLQRDRTARTRRRSPTTSRKPLRILLILVVTYLLVRIARRLDQADVRTAQERAHPPPDQDHPPQDRTVAARHRRDPAPRAAIQRAETIASVLRSVVVDRHLVGRRCSSSSSELGIDLAPLLAGAGVLGVASGFGAQSVVRDFLAGIFMVLEDQYGVGDVIDVGDASGTVEGREPARRPVSATSRASSGTSPTGRSTRVGNKSQQWSRAVLDVPVALDTDIDARDRRDQGDRRRDVARARRGPR